MNSSWMGKGFKSIWWIPIHFCSCGFRGVWWWHAAVPLISWWRQCSSPQPCGMGGEVYLLLSQVSQPGTEHLKEALTLFWIRLTWFMWAGWGFESLLWHSVFHVRLFMRIWRWVLRARGCSLKQRYDLRLGLIPDESESTSRWISCSTLNTQKNMVHEAPHLGNRKEFESRLILWTVIFPRRHLHAPGITGLWGDYRRGKRGYKSKKLFIFTQGTRAHTQQDIETHNNSVCLHVCLICTFLDRFGITIFFQYIYICSPFVPYLFGLLSIISILNSAFLYSISDGLHEHVEPMLNSTTVHADR